MRQARTPLAAGGSRSSAPKGSNYSRQFLKVPFILKAEKGAPQTQRHPGKGLLALAGGRSPQSPALGSTPTLTPPQPGAIWEVTSLARRPRPSPVVGPGASRGATQVRDPLPGPFCCCSALALPAQPTSESALSPSFSPPAQAPDSPPSSVPAPHAVSTLCPSSACPACVCPRLQAPNLPVSAPPEPGERWTNGAGDRAGHPLGVLLGAWGGPGPQRQLALSPSSPIRRGHPQRPAMTSFPQE